MSWADAAILQRATDHMKGAILERALPFSLSPGWMRNVTTVLLTVGSFVSCQEAIVYAQDVRQTGFNHRQPWEANLIAAKLAGLATAFPTISFASLGIYESPLSKADTIWLHEGQPVSNIWFWHLRPVLATLPFPMTTVLEIGSGMGEMARLLYHLRQPKQIILTDLPTSLFFAEIYLRMHWPRLQINYAGAEEIPGAPVVLLPATRISEYVLPHFDMVFNCGGLQEMTRDARDFWLAIIQNYGQHFYSLNESTTPLVLAGWNLISEALKPSMIIEDCVVDRESIWRKEQ